MTKFDASVAKSLDNLKAINDRVRALEEEARKERKAALEPFLEELAASGAVSVIVVRAYTPGFNDGEPCEHSADVFVNVEDVYHNDLGDGEFGFTLPPELIDGFKSRHQYNPEKGRYEVLSDATQHNEAHAAKFGHVFSSPSADILAAIETLILNTAEDENDTDYFVSYILKDGKFEVHSGDYDCGY